MLDASREMTQLMPTHVALSLLIGLVVFTPAKGVEQLQDHFDRIAKEVGAVVGIELKAPVAAERISNDEYRKILRSQIKILFPKNRISGLLRSWQLLGLLPDGKFDFEALVNLTVTATGAAYNPDTKSVQLTPGSEKSLSDETVFHELVHAAQDQRHDLKRTHERLGLPAPTQ